MPECSIDWCNRNVYGRGLCSGHWQRRRRGVDMNQPWKIRNKPGQECCIDGCSNQGGLSLGYCNMHYLRFRTHRDPLKVVVRESRRGQADAIPHGTPSGYSYHGCRCGECRRYKRGEHVQAWLADPDRAATKRHLYYIANRDHVLESNHEWVQRNRAYFTELNKKNVLRYKESTRNGNRHGARWTAEEDLQVTRTDLTLLEIAHVLGRSHSSVTTRRYELRKEQAA